MAADRAPLPPATGWRALVADRRHGPLPVVILVMTAATGVIDAVSVLSLGRVFVANMTGNIAFIGFALAGAPGFSLSSSVVALGAFLVGAAFAGWAMERSGADRARVLLACLYAEMLLVTGALVVAAGAGEPFGDGAQATIAALLALGMGIQNAVVRHIAVPDLTSSVLTMALVGLAVDVRSIRSNPAVLRRVSAVLAMLVGAVVGAEIVLDGSAVGALAVAVGLFALGVAVLATSTREAAAWRRA